MGYNVTLLIGRDTKQVYDDLTYFKINATLDMGNCSRSNLLLLPWENHNTDTAWEFFPPATPDQDDAIVEDKRGNRMKPIPIDDVIAALEKDVKRDNYRPAVWALSLLNKMQTDAITGEAFSVMLYSD